MKKSKRNLTAKFKIGDIVIGKTWAKERGPMKIIEIDSNTYHCKELSDSPMYIIVYQDFDECRKLTKLDLILS